MAAMLKPWLILFRSKSVIIRSYQGFNAPASVQVGAQFTKQSAPGIGTCFHCFASLPEEFTETNYNGDEEPDD